MIDRPIPFTAADLEFVEIEPPPPGPDGRGGVWRKIVAGQVISFRLVRDWERLTAVEALERAVFAGIEDVDVAGPGALVVVPETGGEVIGAYRAGAFGDELIGFAIGWGGYVDGRLRVLSDMLGVRADARSGGLGAELKKLQAAIAVWRGFVDIVWTVDPLRAANARLNFEKLGAYADRYEIDRYGHLAPGLYGGLPTDRLHVTWPLDSPRVRDRLLGRTRPRAADDAIGAPRFEMGCPNPPAFVLVPIPAEIDRLIETDLDAAKEWRFRVRAHLTSAFAAGYAVVGFVGPHDSGGDPALVLEPRATHHKRARAD